MMVAASGIVFRMFPPKRINNIYGYRSKRAKLNEDTWRVANRFSSWAIIILGFMNINAGITCELLLEPPQDMMMTIGILLIQLFFMVFFTERRLKFLFDAEGNRNRIEEV